MWIVFEWFCSFFWPVSSIYRFWFFARIYIRRFFVFDVLVSQGDYEEFLEPEYMPVEFNYSIYEAYFSLIMKILGFLVLVLVLLVVLYQLAYGIIRMVVWSSIYSMEFSHQISQLKFRMHEAAVNPISPIKVNFPAFQFRVLTQELVPQLIGYGIRIGNHLVVPMHVLQAVSVRSDTVVLESRDKTRTLKLDVSVFKFIHNDVAVYEPSYQDMTKLGVQKPSICVFESSSMMIAVDGGSSVGNFKPGREDWIVAVDANTQKGWSGAAYTCLGKLVGMHTGSLSSTENGGVSAPFLAAILSQLEMDKKLEASEDFVHLDREVKTYNVGSYTVSRKADGGFRVQKPDKVEVERKFEQTGRGWAEMMDSSDEEAAEKPRPKREPASRSGQTKPKQVLGFRDTPPEVEAKQPEIKQENLVGPGTSLAIAAATQVVIETLNCLGFLAAPTAGNLSSNLLASESGSQLLARTLSQTLESSVSSNKKKSKKSKATRIPREDQSKNINLLPSTSGIMQAAHVPIKPPQSEC
uniref:Uncharacterized protein n=1 Tax=Hubei sobemo-like virus 17 TaxID=1923202 RepID=A0A1L3KES9_9VIRU|nr:hypothetical protein 1 [Hubei sobemo-like virus 17]